MDCDAVFARLMSRPFPDGGVEDEAIERHLVWCDGCRRFAEALTPDEELRHESVPARERFTLPSYRGAAVTSPDVRSTQRASGHATPWPQRVSAHLPTGQPQLARLTMQVADVDADPVRWLRVIACGAVAVAASCVTVLALAWLAV